MLPVLFAQGAYPRLSISEGILVSRASPPLALRKIAQNRKRNIRRTVGQIKILQLVEDDPILFLTVQKSGNGNQNSSLLHFLSRDKRR